MNRYILSNGLSATDSKAAHHPIESAQIPSNKKTNKQKKRNRKSRSKEKKNKHIHSHHADDLTASKSVGMNGISWFRHWLSFTIRHPSGFDSNRWNVKSNQPIPTRNGGNQTKPDLNPSWIRSESDLNHQLIYREAAVRSHPDRMDDCITH